MRRKWSIAIKRPHFIPTAASSVCSSHFWPEDFFYQFGRKLVKPDVVPSIFISVKKGRKSLAEPIFVSVRGTNEELDEKPILINETSTSEESTFLT